MPFSWDDENRTSSSTFSWDREIPKPETPFTAKVEEAGYEVPDGSGWSLFGDRFKNTLVGVLDVLRTGEYAMGGVMSGKSPITGIREKISPSEALKIADDETSLWSKRGLGALAVDILLDPTTYLTFGTAGVMKLVTKGGQVALTKSGRKLMREMISKGADDSTARSTMAKIIEEGGEEATKKYIAKSGLKFMGKVFIPEANFRAAGKVINMLPGANRTRKVGGGFAKAFVPFRDIDHLPALAGGQATFTDFLYKPFQRQMRYEIFKGLDEIKGIAQKSVKQYGVDVGRRLGEIVESKKLSGDVFLDNIVTQYRKDADIMFDIEKATGKKMGKVQGYLRHYLTEDARDFLTKGIDFDFQKALPIALRVKLQAAKSRSMPGVIKEINAFMREKYEVPKFFEEDFFKSWAKRRAEHIRFVNTTKFLEDVKARFGVRTDKLSESGVKQTKLPIQPELPKVPIAKAISPDFQPLAQEARKYKSAEEFVRGQERLFTGQVGKFDPQKVTGRGVSLTPSRSAAADFADARGLDISVTELFLDKNVKILLTDKIPANIKVPLEQANKTLKEFSKKPFNFAKATTQEVKIQDETFNRLVKEVQDLQKPVRDFAKEQGFDGVRMPELEGEIVVFNPDVLKTKSQLIDFYNQAVRGVLPEIPQIPGAKIVSIAGEAVEEAPRVADKLQPTSMGDVYISNDGVKYIASNNPNLKGFLIPEPIVRHVDKALDVLTNEETLGKFLKLYDKSLALWKANVTGMFIAFHTRNAIGGTFNNWLAGIKAVDQLDTERILQGSDHLIKTDIGTVYHGQAVRDLAERFGVMGQPGQMDVYRKSEEMINELGATGMKWAKLKLSYAPRFAMEQVENRLRLPLFINRIKKGYSPGDAAKDVFKFHFDYMPETGLTPFERTAMKRIFPFYVWMRNNVPLQIEMMLKQPGKYAGIEKIRQHMIGPDAKPGEEEKGLRAEMKWLPDWMKEMFIFPAGLKDEAGKALWTQLDLPLDDIKMLPISSSGIREIASAMSPFLKFPMERYFNKSMYFGGDIWNDDLPRELQTRQTIEELKHLPSPVKKFLNFREVKYRDWTDKNNISFKTRYEMDARKLHIINSFLGRYYSTLKGTFDEEIPAAWKASRYVGGVPVRSFDIEEEKGKRLFEQEKRAQAMLQYLKQHNIIPYERRNKGPAGGKAFSWD
jgi:hypothetical protein